jgi:hypothetical protein
MLRWSLVTCFYIGDPMFFATQGRRMKDNEGSHQLHRGQACWPPQPPAASLLGRQACQLVCAGWEPVSSPRDRIHREQTRYDYLVSAITKEEVSLVLNVVEHHLDHHPYLAPWILTSCLTIRRSQLFTRWSRWGEESLRSCWPLCWSSVLETMRPLSSQPPVSGEDSLPS